MTSDSNLFEINRTNSDDARVLLSRYRKYKEDKAHIQKLSKRSQYKLPSSIEESNFYSLFTSNNQRDSVGLFRKSSDEINPSNRVWLNILDYVVLSELKDVPIEPFQGLDESYLYELARKSPDVGSILELKDLLRQKGILLIYLYAPAGSKTDGVVYKLPSGTPVIGLTLRYSRLDYFWFTLLHELSHICLHYDLLDSPIVEDLEDSEQSETEIQANRLAKFSIVPKSAWRSSELRKFQSTGNLTGLAAEQGVHYSLLAGLIRKELNNYSLFSSVVNEVNVRELLNV